MFRLRPRSFFTLVFLAMGVVSLPLLGVLTLSDLMLSRLFADSAGSVYRSVEQSQLSQGLQVQLVNQERRFKQYQVLGDPALHADLGRDVEQALAILGSLRTLPQTGEAMAALVAMEGLERRIGAAVAVAVPPKPAAVADADWSRLHGLDDRLYALSLVGVSHEVEGLRHEERRAEVTLRVLASTSVPLTILLAVLLTRMIARPVRQIDRGIRLLGKGDFTSKIEVGGPEDLVALGERLNWLGRQLAGYDQEKNKFAAQVSHELKTPLASIHEAAELLGDEVAGPLSPTQREVIDILRKNCHQLEALIRNLVGITMAQAGKDRLTLSDVRLDELIAEAVIVHRPALFNNRIELRTDLAPLGIRADRGRLLTVLDNLLSNAVKFTPEGGWIAVSVKALGDRAEVVVKDSGPGVAEMERERIFSPFFQGSAPCRSPVSGTGLGLAIAREYVEAHRGALEMVSEAGAGACFRLVIPLNLEDKHVS